MATGKEQLERRYAEHHERGGRYGFVFGGEARVQPLVRWVGSGRRVLDLGCRDGSLTRHVVAAGNQVVGVDVDRAALQRCQAALGIPTCWADLSEGLPTIGDAEFDVVVLAEVLEHLPDPALVIAEAARVLRPGGLFVGSVPNAFRLKNRLRFLAGRDFETDPTHLQHFSASRLHDLLAARFATVELVFAVSRFIALSARLFGHCILWRAVKEGGPR